MTIKEKKIYETSFNNEDIKSLANTIELLYQFQNNKAAWDSIKEKSVSASFETTPLSDIITILTEIGGEDYQRYIKRLHKIN